MKRELTSIDETFESLRKEFKPSQIAKFIMEVEKSAYTRAMKNNFKQTFDNPQQQFVSPFQHTVRP